MQEKEITVSQQQAFENNMDLLIEEREISSPKKKKSLWKTMVIPAGVAIWKFKWGILFFKWIFVALKTSKLFVTFGSMLLTIWIYSMFYGWIFAVGFVILIFIHEIGHVLASKKLGFKTSAPMFIPFVGALINLKTTPKTSEQEAYIGIGGPVAGAISALVCYGIYYLTSSPLFLAFGYVAAFLNLFNLLPVHPMDGGRVASVLSPKLWIIGVVILAGWMFVSFNPMMVLILILAIAQIVRTYKMKKHQSEEYLSYYAVPAKKKWGYGVAYFALILLLSTAVIYTQHVLQTIQSTLR